MTGVWQRVTVSVTERHLGNISIIPQNSVLPQYVRCPAEDEARDNKVAITGHAECRHICPALPWSVTPPRVTCHGHYHTWGNILTRNCLKKILFYHCAKRTIFRKISSFRWICSKKHGEMTAPRLLFYWIYWKSLAYHFRPHGPLEEYSPMLPHSMTGIAQLFTANLLTPSLPPHSVCAGDTPSSVTPRSVCHTWLTPS